jgi:uncharacterized membrane protein
MNTLFIGWDINWGWVLGLIIIFAAMWLIVKTIGRKSTLNETSKRSPISVLKERYAKGLISKEEFEEKRRAVL